MATIDCTLDAFMIPGLPTYQNDFGTKKESGVGLSTKECVDVTAMPFNRQRPFEVTEDSTTSEVQANSVFKITQAGITLTLSAAAFDGCKVSILNTSDGLVTIQTSDELVLGADCTLSLIYKDGWLIESGDYCAHGWFHVYTVEGLLAWVKYIEEAEDYSISCVLHNSLDLDGIEWQPVGSETNPYTGTFNGGGQALVNLTVNVEGDAGLFGYLGEGSRVESLRLVNSNITSSSARAGGIVGYCYGSTISNCTNSGTVFSPSYSSYVGGIVGYCAGSTISNCTNSGTVSASSYAGGIVGYCSESTISNCTNSGTVSSSSSSVSYAGGIVGYYSESTISNCTNSGMVSASASSSFVSVSYAGGIVGYCFESTISNCTNSGTVSASASSSSSISYAGGIVGYCYGVSTTYSAIAYCLNKGTASGSSYSGYAVGYRSSTTYCLLSYNVNTGSPSSESGNG